MAGNSILVERPLFPVFPILEVADISAPAIDSLHGFINGYFVLLEFGLMSARRIARKL